MAATVPQPDLLEEGGPIHRLLNDTSRRVHTVMCVAAEKVAQGRNPQALDHNETMAVIQGAASGLAVFCAQMGITVEDPERAKGSDVKPPEVWLADAIREQFLQVFALTVQTDRDAEGAPVN